MCILVTVRLCENPYTAREYLHSFCTGDEYAGVQRGSRLGCLHALGAAPFWRRAFRQFDNHEAGHEDFDSVSVEINGCAVQFGFGNYAATILKMLDVLACREILQNFLLLLFESKRWT